MISLSKQKTGTQVIKPSCLDCGNIMTVVKDTGIGIDAHIVNRLFKIFGTVNRAQS